MKRNLRLAGMAVVMAHFLAACGGLGSSSAPGGNVTVDKVAPAVSYTAPVYNDTAVGLNSSLSVTFSEPMDPSSIGASSLVVNGSGSTVHASGVTYDPGSKSAVYALQTNLAPNTEYSATVTTDVKDLAGNPMAKSYTWAFTTGAGPDLTHPTATSVSPANGQTSVATNAVVAASLDKAMNPQSVISGFQVSDGSSSVQGTVTSLGTMVAFTPAAELKPDTLYTATLTTTAKDLAGNSLATDYSWTFKTGSSRDVAAPAVLATTPGQGAANIAVDSAITVQFNEPLFPFLFGTIDGVPARITFDYSTNVATITPAKTLRSGVTYNAIAQPWDLAGNRMAQFSWSFTTAP